MEDMQALYDRKLVAHMWKELEGIGLKSLTTAAEVDETIKNTKGTTLVVVNSVCGCSAGSARPGVAIALQNSVIPDNLTTVFAGVDMEATARARDLMSGVAPSSPSIAIFKDGQLVHFVPRMEIEGHSDQEVGEALATAFDKHCSRTGPSVPWETVVSVFNADAGPKCGSELKA
jgi:putative YphP/YqiW family bacilliredoxin